MADAVEQTLLLPEDMAELRSMRRHKVFLSLKRYLAMVCIQIGRASCRERVCLAV